MPAKHDVGGSTGALAGWPRLGCERHADTELAAQANPSDGPVSDQVPIASCQSTKTGEDGDIKIVHVSTVIRSLRVPKMSPPATAPSIVHVTSEPA